MLRRVAIVVAALAVFVFLAALLGGSEDGSGRDDGGLATSSGATAGGVGSASDTTTTVVATTAPSAPPSTEARVPLAVPAEPLPEPPAPEPDVAADFSGRGVVVVATGGADLVATPGGSVIVRAREGIAFPAEAIDGEWIRILTTCDETAWVHRSEVAATEAADEMVIGGGFDLSRAVVVVDAGHGGPNIGTSSPDGALLEKDVNVDIARRLRDLLEAPHTVDWDTGTLYVGGAVPAVARVVMTRVGQGPAADYEAGLIYRAALANAAGAHVMVSIHNNAGWEVSLDHPGSDVYYQSQVASSRRLGELMVEEFVRSFEAFDADWVGAIEWGAKSRLSPRDGASQYYGILRRAEMPTVIAEGAYLANASEAALLATAEFRQAYAEAAYRALVRFLTTDDVAVVPSYDPVVWTGFAGSGDPVATCTVPVQGG